MPCERRLSARYRSPEGRACSRTGRPRKDESGATAQAQAVGARSCATPTARAKRAGVRGPARQVHVRESLRRMQLLGAWPVSSEGEGGLERGIHRHEVVQADEVQEPLHGYGNDGQTEPAVAVLRGTVGVAASELPETVALLSAHVFEAAREAKTVSDVMDRAWASTAQPLSARYATLHAPYGRRPNAGKRQCHPARARERTDDRGPVAAQRNRGLVLQVDRDIQRPFPATQVLSSSGGARS
ncbi:hypothetical protein SAMN05444521_7991 [Streptomyces sp. 3214.6]|nr:hypothetical protein SAMN05444521_7991 [Streptomyces sp. 3214.6]